MRAGMDGSFPLAIVSSNLKWPNGITVDQGNSRIYWVDARLDRIETSLLDGTDRHIVPSGSTKHPFSVDILGDRVFWSDWSANEIKARVVCYFVAKELLIIVFIPFLLVTF